MGIAALLGLVAIILCVCEDGINACSDNLNEHVRRSPGENVTLICQTSETCDKIIWEMVDGGDRTTLPTDSHVMHTSFLRKPGITLTDDAVYVCWCSAHAGYNKICEITLQVICEATVFLKGKTDVYDNTSPINHISTTVGDSIQVKCTDGEISSSGCSFITKDVSGEFTYNFVVLPSHNFCTITCWESDENQEYCGVSFTLHVMTLETSTRPSMTSTKVSVVSSQPSPRILTPTPSAAYTASAQSSVNKDTFVATSTSTIFPASAKLVTESDKSSVNKSSSAIIPDGRSIRATTYTAATVVQQTEESTLFTDKSGSFPVMLPIGIFIGVFIGILFFVCFFIHSSRLKSTSRPKKTQTPGNESPDTNIPIGPTYATINKSSPGGDEDSAERGIPCTDDAYDEVGRDVKRETTQQDNAVKAETSITKDYYSVVNTSNTKMESTDTGSKSDNVLYTEVNKEVKQAGTNAGTSSPESSGCNPNVPDVSSNPPYDVLEQPESSEYDAVGVVSTSSALYAVVEKERKKE